MTGVLAAGVVFCLLLGRMPVGWTAALSVLAGLVILAKYRNHRLEVRGERLFYRDLFGKSWEFGVEEIVSVRRDLSENPKLMGENGRVLARCERSMENFPLLIAYLKKHHVWADMI